MADTAPRSSLARAGEVLLLVGAILRSVGAVFVIAVTVVLYYTGRHFLADSGGRAPLAMIAVVYLVMAALAVVTAIMGFVAWNKTRKGQFRASGILGVVAAMLPPVDIIFLLGGTFLLVSDEAKAEQAYARAATEADVRAVTQEP